MLKRIYADNYQCFVNFECQFDSLHLLMGENGSGKTTVFKLLAALRDFIVEGIPTHQAFASSTLTAWDTRIEQKFELDFLGNGGEYAYRLKLQHNKEHPRILIEYEEVVFNNRVLYRLDGLDDKGGRLYDDDSKPSEPFPLNLSRSGISSIQEHPEEYKLLTWFRHRMERVHIFSPDPLRMVAESHAEVARPGRRLHDLASWIRHLIQESPEMRVHLEETLRQGVIEGFEQFRLERAGETTRILKFDFRFGEDANDRRCSLSFNQLSDGQRNLVALFTILYASVESESTVCIDEPDNYVALREIQPWLKELTDRIDDCGGQCMLISHHPELINELAGSHGLRFFRDDLGAARAKPFRYPPDIGILPAEVVARGWEEP